MSLNEATSHIGRSSEKKKIFIDHFGLILGTIRIREFSCKLPVVPLNIKIAITVKPVFHGLLNLEFNPEQMSNPFTCTDCTMAYHK